jgi:Tfp pilus assembly protein PilF
MKRLIRAILFSLTAALVFAPGLAANQSSESSAAHYQSAVDFLKQGKTRDAISDLEKTVKQYPDDTQSRSLLAELYFNQNERTKAEKNYLEVTRMDPMNARAYNNLGILYLKKGDVDKAFESFKTAIEKNPKLVDPYYNLGELAYVSGAPDKASGE